MAFDTAAFDTIAYDVDRDTGVLTITLDRPDALNAATRQMIDELIAAFDAADADDDVRALIVTGRGRGFCAGTDLSGGDATFKSRAGAETGAGTGTDGSRRRPKDPGGPLALRIFDSLKPVIAAVNGAAVGLGATMTLPMDIRFASEPAKFGFVFNRRGISPDACSSWFLPRVVGISRAAEWVMTGRVFPAAEALDAGLVRAVVPPDELLPTARRFAAEIAANCAPVSVALSRQLLWRMLGAAHPSDAHQVESEALASRGRSADAAEGVRSFLEKRPAEFPVRVSDGMPDWFEAWR
jgi:enoyl-CoA hydratase/carnithine racemase